MFQQVDNKEKTNIFKSLNFYMLRTPIFPIEIYEKIFCNHSLLDNGEHDILNIVANSNEIREAILVSSLSLYNELVNIGEEKNHRKREQILSSLVKYLIRMTTRTTPFGLFSGVTRGSFNDLTKIQIDKDRNIKRARPDMEWIYAIIRNIENDKGILDDIHIMRNELVVENGSRLDISYISNYGQLMKDDNLTASIRNTKQVQIVMELTEKPMRYKDLLNTLAFSNPNTDIERIRGFINQLILNEYLITEMRPPLANADPFLYVIEKLNGIKAAEKIYKELSEIRDLIEEYNNLAIGEGEKTYLEIINKMKILHKCKNYIQVDMNIYTEQAYISTDVSNEIEKIAELMLSLSLERNNYDYLGEYMNDFLVEYGDDREIQVLELLDEDKGLGAPSGYSKPPSYKKASYLPESSQSKNIKSFLLNKTIKCLLDNEDEIIIYDEEIEKISSKYKIEEIPESLELYILLSKQQDEEKNGITLHLGPNYGSLNAGKSFGRFRDIMAEKINDDFRELEKKQRELLGEDTIIAEIIELPQSGRSSNVSLNWNNRDYEIVIATNTSGKQKRINISDLFIGIGSKEGKRSFYIKSKSMNKRVVVRANNMLNYTLCSNLYRFLIDVSQHGKRDIISSLYSTFSHCFSSMNYTPRIRYSKTIIYPATWSLNYDVLGLKSNKVPKVDFYKAIVNWKTKWKVPNFVYLQERDNRLLLNLDNKLHLDELYYILSKNYNANITITEIERELNDRIGKGKNGSYCTEIVVPITKNIVFREDNENNAKINSYSTRSDYMSKRNELSTFDSRRIFYPGDKWLSLKLYGNSRRLDEFIGFNIMPLCKELLVQNEIEKFFFLRYSDPESHIRLRLHGKKEIIQNKIFPELNLYFKQLLEDGLLSKAVIDTYKREVERYGGIELIELAETVFYYDSIFVCNLIEHIRTNKLGISIEIIMVASIINMMEELGVIYEVQRDIFMDTFDRNLHRKIFQNSRREILSICNSNDEWGGLRAIQGGNFIYDLFELRKNSLNNFGNKMIKLDDIGELWSSKKSILFSLIHMHCNRMFGSNQKEQLVLATVRHTLHALEFFKKQQSTAK